MFSMRFEKASGYALLVPFNAIRYFKPTERSLDHNSVIITLDSSH